VRRFGHGDHRPDENPAVSLHALPVESRTAGADIGPTGRRGARALPQVGVRVIGTDPLSREGVIRFLQEGADVVVVDEDDTVAAHVAVVVVDRLTDDTISALRAIRKEVGPRIVLLVGDLDTDRIHEAMEVGAVGIMRRVEVTQGSLGRLIRSVFEGEAVVPPDLLTALLGRHPLADTVFHRSGRLGVSAREQRVLRLLADGADTREIAHRLCYSERTVKTVIQDIANRFGLRNRAHAVAYAIRQGLI
jgi:DNA-binding NarL/FixJ family response regulator